MSACVSGQLPRAGQNRSARGTPLLSNGRSGRRTIIPASEIRTKTLYLPPRERAARSRYGRFLEAWHLLGGGRNGRLTILASAENDLMLEMIRAKVVELSEGASRLEQRGLVHIGDT